MEVEIETEPTVPYPPRFWWLKRIVVCSVLSIIAYASIMGWWAHAAHRRLQSEIDTVHARGEPVLVEDYKTKPVPDASNAAISLLAAQQAVVLTAAQHDFLDNFNPRSQIDAAAMKTLEQINLANTATWQLARLARFQPQADWGVRMTSPTINITLTSLGPQRNLASLLNANALYEHSAGHEAEAIETIRDILRQSDFFQQHSPTVVGHLVAIAIGEMTFETIQQISFNIDILKDSGATTSPSSPASRQQVLSLISELLDERAYRQGLINAMQGERTLQYDSSATQAGRVAASRVILPPSLFVMDLLQPMFELDTVRMMGYMKRTIAGSAQSSYPAAKADLPDTYNLKAGIAPLTAASRIMTLMMMPSLDRAVQVHFRNLTDRRVAALFLAVRLYKHDHNGRLPEALSDLVPSYLSSLPIDPFSPSSESLKYQVSPAPLIYSVGTDGKDDGGAASFPSSAPTWAIASTKPAGDPSDGAKWERRDVIYPLTKYSPLPATNGN